MIVKIYPENPNNKQIEKVVEILRKGGIIVYPTDSVYGMGCDIHNRKAVEKIAKLRGIKPDKAQFSMICHDLSQISAYTKPLDNSVFKLMKKNLPGPFTFILNANSKVPALFVSNKKTIGIRIPNNRIVIDVVKAFGSPILTTSVHDEDEILEYTTDPELIHENLGEVIDLVIDGGYGHNIASTVIDCTNSESIIIRQGIGELL